MGVFDFIKRGPSDEALELIAPGFNAALASAPPAVPAHKQSTGNSTYQAEGIVDPGTELNELGSGIPVQIRELVPQILSPALRLQLYGQMMTDAGVDVSIRAAKTPILGAEFYIDGFSEDPNDELVRDFVDSNLMGGLSAPFTNSIEDILRMYTDGFAVLEKVYEERQWTPSAKGSNGKTYTMLKKLAVRPTSTLGLITYDDNGGPASIAHNAIRADRSVETIDLPADKVLIFTFQRNGGDLTGKSLLRTAHQHWFYKNHFYKLDAIQKERHSIGVPKGKLTAGFKPKDVTILRTLLRNIRTNEESFFIEPPNIEIGFAEFHGQLINNIDSANHHNAMLLLNVLAQFLALGLDTGGGGGRATAATGADIYMKAFRFVANYMAEVINMYVIPELVVYNFKTTNFPQMKVRNIGETRDLQMLASALANLIHEGGITVDDDTENWFRSVFDMPALATLGQVRNKPSAQTPQQQNPNGTGGVAGGGTAPKPANAMASNGNGHHPAQLVMPMPDFHVTMPEQHNITRDYHTNNHSHHIEAPVEVSNEYAFEPKNEVHIDEGAVQVTVPPINMDVKIVMPDGDAQQVLEEESQVVKNIDGSFSVRKRFLRGSK